MGQQDVAGRVSADRGLYREKVRRCLDALALMLRDNLFSFGQRQMGLEIELNLVDPQLRPAMANSVVLEKINDPRFTTELGQQNLELNVPPRPLSGNEAVALEQELRQSLNDADAKAKDAGASLVLIGMLPTLRPEHFDARWLSAGGRYTVLNDEIFAARGEDMLLDIEGTAMPGRAAERLHARCSSILGESACTSVQLHLQVAPEDFAAYWNAAQCLAGVQVALAGNSPFLLGRALWHETRIPLFQQATDTRPEELRNQGVRPRVWFGERWITSIFDLFEENARYFPSLLPETDDEEPLVALAAGNAPKLAELRLHNGTVWRWNRPVYDLADGVPHLRLENRVLPAGPTVIDLIANAALFYGAQRALAAQDRPLWTQMSFQAAEENLRAAARDGMGAQLYWPAVGWISPAELVLRKLLPLAHDGLRELGMADSARERYLGIIEQRCLLRQTGSTWQRDTVALLEERGATRDGALTGMLREYVDLMRGGEPVHTWPVG
ncbi:MAG TPA: glutamate--cysteine ligase [Pseudonocardiaceae bacterium]|nr:glutamate--cysteine ligase [Pseudonocardiaceae bacterium]